jgi:hypothetical protein
VRTPDAVDEQGNLPHGARVLVGLFLVIITRAASVRNVLHPPGTPCLRGGDLAGHGAVAMQAGQRAC